MATRLTNAQETAMLQELRGKLFVLYTDFWDECQKEHGVEAATEDMPALRILSQAGAFITERLNHLEFERKLYGDKVEEERAAQREESRKFAQQVFEKAKKAGSDNGN